jgi:hypothetical protein
MISSDGDFGLRPKSGLALRVTDVGHQFPERTEQTLTVSCQKSAVLPDLRPIAAVRARV